MTTIQENLTLTITPQVNVLDGIVLYEPCDVQILDKLIHSTLLRVNFNNKMAGVIYENEKQQLIKYKENFSQGRARVLYQRQQGNPYGRSNPIASLGLFPIRREIRHTLAKSRFKDIDVKNCHPDMKLQICIKNNIECTELRKYVLFRQKYFDETVRCYGCSEEEAKNLFIILLYGGGLNDWLFKNKIHVSKVLMEYVGMGELLEYPDIKLFKLEQEKMNNIIMENNPHLKETVIKVKEEQGKKNLTEKKLAGCCCAFYLQEYEIRVLEQIYKYCVEKEYIRNDNCVLCADGLMLEKEFISANILIELETVVYDKLGFKLTLTNKEMDKDYLSILDENVIFDYYFDYQIFHNITQGEKFKVDRTKVIEMELEKLKLVELKAPTKDINNKIKDELKKNEDALALEIYNRRKEYFEKFHFKVMSPFCIGRKVERGYEFVSKPIFINCYENLENRFDLLWLIDKKIRTYEKCDFCPPPLKIDESTFNLFNTLDGEKLILTNKEIIDENALGKKSEVFIKQLWLLTGKSNDCLEYCLDFLAHIIQKPGELPRTALIFKSVQGVGKNLFFEGFSNKILNKSYMLSTSDLDHIIGRFPQINQKLVVLMDEAKGKDTFVGSDRIKSYITAPTLVYEKKGIDGMTINNCSRMIFLTNNENGVLIEQTDRRFIAMESSSDFANNAKYMKTLLKAFDTPSMVRNFYLFLKKRDIINFDSTNDRPITQFYKEMRTVTTPTEIKFFNDKILDWSGNQEIVVKGKDCYEDYKLWCGRFSTPYKAISEMSFIKRLNDKEKKEFVTLQKGRDTNYYHINIPNLEKFIKKNTVEYVDIIEDNYLEKYTSTEEQQIPDIVKQNKIYSMEQEIKEELVKKVVEIEVIEKVVEIEDKGDIEIYEYVIGDKSYYKDDKNNMYDFETQDLVGKFDTKNKCFIPLKNKIDIAQTPPPIIWKKRLPTIEK